MQFADYEQWLKYVKQKRKDEKLNKAEKNKSDKASTLSKVRKLTFKEKKELEGIEDKISLKEEELENTKNLLNSNDVISNHIKLLEVTTNLENLEKELQDLYDRWEYLSSF